MARGQPNRPAPVSGPSNLARRTDGGPGSETQPLRTPTGGDYGDAAALTSQQQSAPLAVASSGGGGPVPPGRPTPPVTSVFGPTERPGEDPSTGGQLRGPMVAQDVEGFLRVLYAQFPHPAIYQLLRKG